MNNKMNNSTEDLENYIDKKIAEIAKEKKKTFLKDCILELNNYVDEYNNKFLCFVENNCWEKIKKEIIDKKNNKYKGFLILIYNNFRVEWTGVYIYKINDNVCIKYSVKFKDLQVLDRVGDNFRSTTLYDSFYKDNNRIIKKLKKVEKNMYIIMNDLFFMDI